MGWFKNLRANETNEHDLTKQDNDGMRLKKDVNTKIEEFSPIKYGEAETIANTLILGKPIKLNLKNTEISDRKRIIDFLCGIAFVLDFDVKHVASNTYEFIKN